MDKARSIFNTKQKNYHLGQIVGTWSLDYNCAVGNRKLLMQ